MHPPLSKQSYISETKFSNLCSTLFYHRLRRHHNHHHHPHCHHHHHHHITTTTVINIIVVVVPSDSPSRGGDVAVYFSEVNQPNLPTPFYSVLVSVSVFLALSTVFHFISSPDISPLSRCVLPVLFRPHSALSIIHLFMKVSLSPHVILCGWLALKHQLRN